MARTSRVIGLLHSASRLKQLLLHRQPPAAEPATPVWVWVIIAIGAILVIVTLILIFKTRRV